MFHWMKGTPFDQDQGKFKHLTMWEQIDDGQQFTPNRKFLTALPIALYVLLANISIELADVFDG